MKIYVECEFCNSNFDTKEHKGICPSCGARYSKKVNLVERNEEYEQNISKSFVKKSKNNKSKKLNLMDYPLIKKISAMIQLFVIFFIMFAGVFLMEEFVFL